jgi:hypothetical protein
MRDEANVGLRWMRRRFAMFVLVGVASVPGALAGQDIATASFDGRVRDQGGGAVAGAVIQLRRRDESRLTSRETSALGSFRFEGLLAGTYDVFVRRLGFRQDSLEVVLAEGQTSSLDFILTPVPVALEGIQVRVDVERSRERARFEELAGATRRELAVAELKLVPGVGEADPIRAVEVLPGVISTSDFTAAFNVRGGSADQNLILLDGLQIFNPFHMGGFFSVFNADMVERAELLSGGFPAEYGGRVSSVLAVESEAGDGDFQIDGGASLLASRIAVGWRIPERVSNALGFQSMRWRVSGRRSYFDVLAKEFPYRLVDGQGVFEAWTRGGSRLQVTAYSGRDILDLNEATLNSNTSSEDSLEIPLEIDWKWGNDAIGARWTTPKADGGFVEARVSFSRFDNLLSFPEEDVTYGTSIDAFRSGIDLEEHLGRRWTIRTGVGTEHLGYDNLLEVNNAQFQDVGGRGWLHSGYLQTNWENGNWLFEVGARLDHWRPTTGEALWEPAPRLAVKRFLGDRNAAIKLAAGRYTQFLHSLRDEELPIGIDTWVLSGEQAPSVVSNQVQLGYERYFGQNWFASIEGYARRFEGITVVNSGEDPNDITDDLLEGTGTSFGADLFLRRTGEGITGWISLSFLKANRTFPDYLSGLVPAPQLSTPPIYDRRLDIDVVLRYELRWGIQSGLRWNLGTGLPYTRPIGKYALYYPRGTEDGRLDASTFTEDDELKYSYGVVLGPRSGERYPVYTRLDLSFRKTYEKSWGRITPHLDLLNAYNKRNPLFYFFNFENTPPTRSGVSMFPILPTIGVEVSF